MYITFISINWKLQKCIHSSDTVFHAAWWSSNLHIDDTNLNLNLMDIFFLWFILKKVDKCRSCFIWLINNWYLQELRACAITVTTRGCSTSASPSGSSSSSCSSSTSSSVPPCPAPAPRYSYCSCLLCVQQ